MTAGCVDNQVSGIKNQGWRFFGDGRDRCFKRSFCGLLFAGVYMGACGCMYIIGYSPVVMTLLLFLLVALVRSLYDAWKTDISHIHRSLLPGMVFM